MIKSHHKSTETGYTTRVALVILALAFSPSVLMVSLPFGYVSVSLAFGFSAFCTALAWVNWNKNSNLTIPSIMNWYPTAR